MRDDRIPGFKTEIKKKLLDAIGAVDVDGDNARWHTDVELPVKEALTIIEMICFSLYEDEHPR